jgi:hypothetical protein
MNTRHWLVAVAVALATQADVHGLTPPSSSDGPVKLLGCIVTSQRILEAEVDNTSDETMNCAIRCNYDIGESRLSYTFNVTIPKRFQGRVGRFDTETGKAGSYSGDVGSCEAVSRHGT